MTLLDDIQIPADPAKEALIRANEDLQASLRRRKETIQAMRLSHKAEIAELAAPDPLDAIRGLQKRIGEANAAKGFHQEGDQLRALLVSKWGKTYAAPARNYYTARLALITTEVAEAIEELRHGRAVDETWYSANVDGINFAWIEGEWPEVLSKDRGIIGKPEGVPSEIADVVIRAFDFAHEAGIDLAAMIEEKISYNATREHLHGKTF